MADQHDTTARGRKNSHDDSATDPESLREDERQSREPDGRRERDVHRDERKDEKPRKRSPWTLIIVAIVVVAVLIAGAIYWFSTRDLESTDDAYTDGRAVTIAPHVSGYVIALDVNDNQRVKAGQVLAVIDPRDFQAARDQAEGNLRVAEAQLENGRISLETAKISYPAKLAAARAQLDSARAALANAQAEYNRQHSVPRAATTQQNIDTSTANLRTAQAQVEQAEAQVRENDLVPQLIAQAEAQVHQLEGQVEQARAQLAQANLNLSWTKITAPQEGWITQRRIEKGNLVQSGQAIFSVVTPDVWIVANFKETQLDRIRPGQKVDISVDAYPDLKLTGHVDSIQLGSGAQFAALPPENATGNFVKIVRRVPVKIDIDHGLPPDMMLPLGISVTPTVHLK
ncbi:MAG: efflux RND transporter periplasmic adaptor subunit [Alphaproteobacteria bacterium]|nr:efflux RND transporter periplasmic adaptor subunit [Alphaproteobacteria bacterium]